MRPVGTALAAALWLPLLVPSPALAAGEDAMWPDLREMLFGERPIADGAGVIAIEAPYRAPDAAIVPITIRAGPPRDDAPGGKAIRTVTLLIDDNPAPVAAVFHLSPRIADATLATRVRINAYTNVRAVAETADGRLFMAHRFVKASGGCSAPALKNEEAALARLGRMKLRWAEAEDGGARGAQLLISHPNYSGMQMDPLTRHYIPAHYVEEIRVAQGGETVLRVEAGISLSEDPSIRFRFVPSGDGALEVEARDNEGQVFTRAWPLPAGTGS